MSEVLIMWRIYSDRLEQRWRYFFKSIRNGIYSAKKKKLLKQLSTISQQLKLERTFHYGNATTENLQNERSRLLKEIGKINNKM